LAVDLLREAIVLETDSPDIPPAWVGRGRNSPAELPRITETLAHVAEQTRRNAEQVFCRS
jgi:TatD DNase family protein